MYTYSSHSQQSWVWAFFVHKFYNLHPPPPFSHPKGTVLINAWTDKPVVQSVVQMVTGKANTLQSKVGYMTMSETVLKKQLVYIPKNLRMDNQDLKS